MTLYAIDPGTEQSALVTVSHDLKVCGAMWDNADLLNALRSSVFGAFQSDPVRLLVEEIQSYGMPVGREVFETVFWSGQFVEAWQSRAQRRWTRIGRKDIKLALCGSPRAKDANIRQALIDRYGGSQCIKKGGALYGIKSHLWAALALAETYRMQQQRIDVDGGQGETPGTVQNNAKNVRESASDEGK